MLALLLYFGSSEFESPTMAAANAADDQMVGMIQTHFETRTGYYSVEDGVTLTDVNGKQEEVPTKYLKYEQTEYTVYTYIPLENDTSSLKSPTPDLPIYVWPPVFIGVLFGIVFIVGFIYTNCCISTVIRINTRKKDDIDLILEDLDHNEKKKKANSKKSKKGKTKK